MSRSAKLMMAGVVVPLTIAACTSVTGSAPHTRPPAVRCAAQALVLHPGAYVSPLTGEHAMMYALTNRGSAACTLKGYPQVVLTDATGAVLPFRYAKGGGAYVTSAKPVTVVLAPGASAYVLVAKYRCDLGVHSNATAIRLTLPTAHGTAFAGREAVGVSGSTGMSYCRGGRHDPGLAPHPRHDHERRCPPAPRRIICPGHGHPPQHRHRRHPLSRVHRHRPRTALGSTRRRAPDRSARSHIVRMIRALAAELEPYVPFNLDEEGGDYERYA